MSHRSSLSKWVGAEYSCPVRANGPWGMCVHTSGSGINKRAIEDGDHVDHAALDYYATSKYSTHYVIGHLGVYQIHEDNRRVSHIGMSDPKTARRASDVRRRYLDGKWTEDVPDAFVARWRAQWGKVSPSHLYPSQWPSDDYLAVELLPCDGFATPMRPGMRYSRRQHHELARLVTDCARRHRWPAQWWRTPRLCTHESLTPHSRVTRSGEGWDPGVLRDTPWIDWALVKGLCAMLSSR